MFKTKKQLLTNKLSDLALGSEYLEASNYQHISDLPPALLTLKIPEDMKMFLQLSTERGILLHPYPNYGTDFISSFKKS